MYGARWVWIVKSRVEACITINYGICQAGWAVDDRDFSFTPRFRPGYIIMQACFESIQ